MVNSSDTLFETETFLITTSGKWYELRLNDGVENPVILSFNRNTPDIFNFMANQFDSMKDELDAVLEYFTFEEDELFPGTKDQLDGLLDPDSHRDNEESR